MVRRTLTRARLSGTPVISERTFLRSMITADRGDGAEGRLLAARHAEEFPAPIAAHRAYRDEFAITLAMIMRS
jgi:hypothetical protein